MPLVRDYSKFEKNLIEARNIIVEQQNLIVKIYNSKKEKRGILKKFDNLNRKIEELRKIYNEIIIFIKTKKSEDLIENKLEEFNRIREQIEFDILTL
jgi:precorrin-3B methylase